MEMNLYLGISIGFGFAALATFVFMQFGLNRYLASKNLSSDEVKKGQKAAKLLAVGTAVLVLFLIPFFKMIMEERAIIWAIVVSSALLIIGVSICVMGGINWNQEVVSKENKNDNTPSEI